MINRALIPIRLPDLSLLPAMQVLFPMALWTLLWLSVFNLDVVENVLFEPTIRTGIYLDLRKSIPLVAAALAGAVILFKVYRWRYDGSLLLSPLGLAAAYGSVGVVSSLLSPDGSKALYWALAYLSVPLVIWAIAWGPNSREIVSHIIKFNWIFLISGVVVLFVVALRYLDLGNLILSPSSWLRCELNSSFHGQSWHDLTGGALRPTGVGRYAALAGIISLGAIWRGGWRPIWGILLLISMVLLVSSGARAAFLGFGAAGVLISFWHGGRKAVAGVIVTAAIIVLALWSTGAHSTFMNECVLRVWANLEPATGPDQASSQQSSANPQQTTDLAPSSQASAQAPASQQRDIESQDDGVLPRGFFQFTGRTEVWAEGVRLWSDSPLLGRGFQADRLLIGSHMHNTFLHALIQTGLIGGLPFFLALLLGWYLLYKASRNFETIPVMHRHLVIQSGGVLVFFSVRSFLESSGAFYGVDWFILGPILLYLQLVNRKSPGEPATT